MRHFSIRKALPAISVAVSLCFAVFIALFFDGNMAALLKEREKELIEIHQEQIVSLLLRDSENLSFSLRDWATKESTYCFVRDSSPAARATMMQTNPIFLLRLNYAAIIARSGFVSERYFDYERNEELDEIPHAAEIGAIARWLYRETQSRYSTVGPGGDIFGTLSHSQYSGFVGVGRDVYYFTAAPILPPDNDGSSNGTMIFGRRIAEKELDPSAQAHGGHGGAAKMRRARQKRRSSPSPRRGPGCGTSARRDTPPTAGIS